MSSYMVVAGVSEALRRVLWEEISADPEVSQHFPSEQDIAFKNPTETVRNPSNRLSLWLYQITENEFMKNQPMERGNRQDQQHFPPLALNLSYLITPFANTNGSDSARRDEDHLIIGKVLQVFHDNSTILLRDSVNDIAEELRIIFKRLTLEELTRIWEALREPYRLSVCYQVQVTRVDSRRVSTQARVIEREAGYGSTPTTGEA